MAVNYSKKTLIVVIIGVVIFVGRILFSILGGVGSANETAIDQYLNEDLEALGVAENLESSGKDLETIFTDIQKSLEANEELDLAVIEEDVNSVLLNMEDTKKAIESLEFEDEEIYSINQNLIKAYEYMISGYRTIVDGLKNADEGIIGEGQKQVLEAENFIIEWKKLLNE